MFSLNLGPVSRVQPHFAAKPDRNPVTKEQIGDYFTHHPPSGAEITGTAQTMMALNLFPQQLSAPDAARRIIYAQRIMEYI
jgi:hypothetical protein